MGSGDELYLNAVTFWGGKNRVEASWEITWCQLEDFARHGLMCRGTSILEPGHEVFPLYWKLTKNDGLVIATLIMSNHLIKREIQ